MNGGKISEMEVNFRERERERERESGREGDRERKDCAKESNI